MCKVDDTWWIYYVQGSKKDQHNKRKRKETYNVGWLKPLQATYDINFIFHSKKMIILRPNEIQELYFEGHSKERTGLTTNILACMAYKTKNRVNIQNALRWLYASTYASCNKSGWLTQKVVEYEDKEVLDELTKDGPQIFHKKLAFISSTLILCSRHHT
jgi:hypothetical protein